MTLISLKNYAILCSTLVHLGIFNAIFALESLPEKSIIRAQCIMTPKQEKHWTGLLKLSPLLQELGIIFVENNPDIILCNHFTPHVRELNKPTIILEKRDAASIGTRTRKIIHEPLVIAVFKNRGLRNKFFDNDPQVEQNFLLTTINEYAHLEGIVKKEVKQIAPKDLAKIHVITWDFLQSAFNAKLKKLRDKPLDLKHERPVDVSFVGSIHCQKASAVKNLFYSWHRTKALDAITSMQDLNVYAQPGKKLPYPEYLNLMTNSKICVSPWGFGEWCYRDIEAILCGAILIKPDTDFVYTEPDIYHKDKYYIACKPDFSDLQEKIAYVLSHYEEFDEMRQRAYDLVQTGWDAQTLAQKFAHAVHAAFSHIASHCPSELYPRNTEWPGQAPKIHNKTFARSASSSSPSSRGQAPSRSNYKNKSHARIP